VNHSLLELPGDPQCVLQVRLVCSSTVLGDSVLPALCASRILRSLVGGRQTVKHRNHPDSQLARGQYFTLAQRGDLPDVTIDHIRSIMTIKEPVNPRGHIDSQDETAVLVGQNNGLGEFFVFFTEAPFHCHGCSTSPQVLRRGSPHRITLADIAVSETLREANLSVGTKSLQIDIRKKVYSVL
jgi:hypothetical protein